MSLDTIALIKLLSLIATAGFTILGVLTKDKKVGRVTWGRVSATGAIVSLLLSVVLFGLEQRALADSNTRAAAAQQEANARFDAILARVEDNIKGTNKTLIQTGVIASGVEKSVEGQERVVAQTRTIATNLGKSIGEQRKILKGTDLTVKGIGQVAQDQLQLQKQQDVIITNTVKALTPLNPLAFAFAFSYSLDDQRIRPYVQRLQKTAESHSIGRFTYNPELKIFVTRRLDNNEISSVEVGYGSKLFPEKNRQDESRAADLLNITILNLLFYKNAPSLPPSTSTRDLYLQAVATSAPEGGVPALNGKPLKRFASGSTDMYLLIDFDNNRLIQNVFTDNIEPVYSTHKLGSFLDLENAVLEVRQGGPEPPRLDAFEIRTGNNYQQSYVFDPKVFHQTDTAGTRSLYHRFTKEDFKISL